MTAWDNFELVTLNCKATWLSLWVECFDMTGGKGLHAYLCVARRQTLHLADGYGGMRASASVIAIAIEKYRNQKPVPRNISFRGDYDYV
jgi:hypothetical protein